MRRFRSRYRQASDEYFRACFYVPRFYLMSSLCAIQDTDRSGTIGFNEVIIHELLLPFTRCLTYSQFAGLWKYIKVCARWQTRTLMGFLTKGT
jgi:hypothetical protein